MPNVLILDNSVHRSIYGPVAHWARHLGCPYAVIRPPDGETFSPADLKPQTGRFTHLIVTGSEASITQDDDWIAQQCRLVWETAFQGTPILASCFGHQLIVRAISGKEFVRRSPTPEFGWLEVTVGMDGRGDPVLGVLPAKVHVFSSHFDEVHPLPDEWQCLAASEGCVSAAVKWRKGPVWGLQHHPEIGFADGECLLAALESLMPESWDLVQSRLRPTHRDSMVTPALVAAFLAQPPGPP